MRLLLKSQVLQWRALARRESLRIMVNPLEDDRSMLSNRAAALILFFVSLVMMAGSLSSLFNETLRPPVVSGLGLLLRSSLAIFCIAVVYYIRDNRLRVCSLLFALTIALRLILQLLNVSPELRTGLLIILTATWIAVMVLAVAVIKVPHD